MKLNAWLPVLCLLGSTSSARAQELVESHYGANFDKVGACVASAGDVDGDAIPDTMVASAGVFEVKIYAGSNGAGIRTLTGDSSGFGAALLGTGDLNGDGRDDVAVCSRNAGIGGQVRFYSGKTGALLRTIKGAWTSGQFGTAICRAGDVDGDGHEELAIGAPKAGTGSFGSQGAVYLYSYAKDSILRVLTPMTSDVTEFGRVLVNAGDVDDDGFQDLVVGALTPNAVWLYSGLNGFVLRTFTGSDSFGSSAIGLGPIGESGHEWIAIGSPTEDDTGVVRVFDAVTGATVRTIAGNSDSNFGFSLGCGDDPNVAVGNHNLIVGAPGNNGGIVFVFDPSGVTLATLGSPQGFPQFGASVAGLPSRDGDAYAEICVGRTTGIFDSGAMFVFKDPAGCGPIVEHGAGCPGFLGVVPKLHMSGCALAHKASSLTLTLEHGPGFATTALLFLGAGSGTMPLPNGCSFAFAQIFGSPIVLPLATGMHGPLWPIPSSGIVVPATVPAIGYGFTIGLQAAVLDPTAQSGFSTTNAVTMAFLP